MCNKIAFIAFFVIVLSPAINTAIAELVAYYSLDEVIGELLTSSRVTAKQVEVFSCPYTSVRQLS